MLAKFDKEKLDLFEEEALEAEIKQADIAGPAQHG